MNQSFVSKAGICCFSEKPNSHLMWSHYAGSHTGFCIGFRTDNNLMQSQFLRPVTYPKRGGQTKVGVTTESDPEHKENVASLADAHFDILCEKSEEWKYEDEWRFITNKPNSVINYPAEIVDSIYFGMKSTSHQHNIIYSILSRHYIGKEMPKFEFARKGSEMWSIEFDRKYID